MQSLFSIIKTVPKPLIPNQTRSLFFSPVSESLSYATKQRLTAGFVSISMQQKMSSCKYDCSSALNLSVLPPAYVPLQPKCRQESRAKVDSASHKLSVVREWHHATMTWLWRFIAFVIIVFIFWMRWHPLSVFQIICLCEPEIFSLCERVCHARKCPYFQANGQAYFHSTTCHSWLMC